MSEILSENYTEKSIKGSTHKCIRKVMINGNDNNVMDELIKKDFSDSECSSDQRHERRELKNGVSRAKHRLTTFSLHSVIDGEVQSKFNITCLLCKRRFACNSARSTFLVSSSEAYYICDDCMENEKGHAEELEATLLVSSIKNNDKTRSVSIGYTDADLSAYDHCRCQNCVRRQLMDEERRKEIEVLQRCWHDLRQNIRQMFRDGLNANMTSSKGKRFDVDKIKRNVMILAEKDPHQLYKRLESIGHEYVMSLKSDDLWQILVAPQVVPALIQLYEAGASEEQMELERAKLFIKTLLDRFSCQQETARNMSPLLAVLDEDYLSQFGISWKVVNHHIFDRVIYQDDLLLNYLPSLENTLKCKLIVYDDEDEEDRRQRACTEASRTDIPQGALELAQSFRVFHKLMVTSREIFKKASANIVLYTEQQKVINHIKHKAKGELLKEDLKFFKSQRKMIRSCILRKGQYYQGHADLTAFEDLTDLIDECDNSDSEADDVNVSESLHELIEKGPATSVCIDENREVLPCIRCKRCTVRHCSCDECRISHIITCGLLIDSEDISNLIWPMSDYCDRSDERKSDSKHSQRKISSVPNIKRLPNHSLRFQSEEALFTVHDHHNKKETAWGDWQVPYGYSDDIDYLGHCLCEKKGMGSDFGSLNNQTDGEEEHPTDTSDSSDLTNGEKYQEIVKGAFELMTKGQRMGSSPICKFESNDVPRTSSVISEEKTTTIGEGDKHEVKSSFLMKKANLRSEGFTIASVSNINVKRFKIKKVGSNVAGDSDGTESDYETSSTSFPGSNECMDNCHLSGPDRLLLKEMTRKHYTVLSKDNAVSDLALEIFGRKAMEKPQKLHKAGLTPPVSRLIRKSKLVSDKSDASSGGISAVKSLSASARERLLNEVKDMDKKVRERSLLRFVQSYEDEHWTTKSSEDYQDRLLESMRECLPKDRTKEDDDTDLRTSVKDEKNCNSAREIVNRKSTAKISDQEERADREMIYIPETRTMVSFATTFSPSSTDKKAKSLPRKVEHENLAQFWSKQTLAAAIAKQFNNQRTVFDINRSFSVEKRKVAKTVSCKSNHLDAMSNSANGIDFSVDLGEFDINAFPEEVRKMHEEGKLKKLLKQAIGLKRNKTDVSAKGGCKHDDSKRVENELRDSKEELFGYQTDDLTDEDDEGTDEEWTDCEAPNEQHPHRHHSCDNKIKNKRTASGTGRDRRHGHCDCCYCEMFGHAATENDKSGRTQIRERLRMKLKRRNVQEHSGTGAKNLEEKLTHDTANQESKKSPAVIPDTPIEEILEYINEKDIVAAQAAANKAAKRARQKLRKQEEKERQNRERKLKEEQKKITEAELLNKKKEQQAAQQEVKKEKQSKPETKKKKADRMRGKKQKNGRDRKKENELQLSESQKVEVRKEPVLEFEYWNDPKCNPKFKRPESTKEQVGTSKVGRAKTQNKEESKKNEGVSKRSELEDKRENEFTKNEIMETNSVLEKDDNNSSKNENRAVESETVSPINCAAMLSKTENHKSEGIIQPTIKPSLHKESDTPSTALTVNGTSTILPKVEFMTQSSGVSCPIVEHPPKMFPPPKISLSEISANTNLSHILPFPVLSIPPPSQTNIGFGICQGGVGYYTHFGEQPQIYPISGLNQHVVSSPDQNIPVLSATSANFAQDSVLRPLQIPPTYEARSCQIGINDVHISGQYSIPPPASAPLTDISQKTGPISSIPIFDSKSFETPTSFSCFGFQKLPQHASETSSLSSLSSSLSSSSSKPSPRNLPLDITSKGNTITIQMPSLGVMNAPLQNNSCSNNGAVQNFLSADTAAQRFTLPGSPSCPKQRLPNVAVSGVAATKIQKSPQCTNAQFLVNHQNGMSTTGINAAETNKIETGETLPGSSQLTAAFRAKRNEASKTFLSSSNPLANYDSETRKLAAFAKEDDIFHNQNPMIFEPGDPRIAVAIAEMKFDPYEVFKPRPDSELEFLDPFELEMEHFKRVMWEEGQITKPRIPLRELRKIDPENEPGAVFHFAPLV
ncbi:hypothetical protein ACH3XW_47705 [Acanthocheilonema viteae]